VHLDRIGSIVQRYVAAWNETDVVSRADMIESCWAIGGIYIDPSVHLVGRDALSLHITSVQARRPGARVELVSGIDAHHQVLRFEWRVVQSDGTCGLTSTDFGEVSDDGLLSKIIGFFGPAPHGEAAAQTRD
jgi:SnoaL-like domain